MREVIYSVDDPVALIRLNRPECYNAFTVPMLDEIRLSVERADRDPAVVGIVITGTGGGFCSGADTRVLAGDVGKDSPYRAVGDMDPTPDLFSYLLRADKPVIAAVNGVAAGGGFVLALMADLRFADPNARFTTGFSKMGLVAEHGSSWSLPRLIGPSKALDLLFTSRMVDAPEALILGLVDRIARTTALEEARDYIKVLAETVSPHALRESKRLVYQHLGDHDTAVREAWNTMIDSFGGPDPKEGATAFLERRPPRFRRIGRQQEP